MIIKHNKVQWQ